MSDATTILFIDGNQQDLDYYTHRLRTSSPDYDVVQAATGKAGLDRCARQPIDCVILEIDLPDMSGFEVLLKLIPRAYQPEVAVVVLTRLTNPYLLDAAVRNGAQVALQKTMALGDILDKAVLKALSIVPKEKAHKVHSRPNHKHSPSMKGIGQDGIHSIPS